MRNPVLKLLFIIVLNVVISSNAASEAILKNVPNQGYYKDVFFDCGIGLTTRDTLPAVKMLGLSTERVAYNAISDAPLQNQYIAGDSTDWNGRLLYPDGQPRFKMIFIDGGSSTIHGTSLGEAGRRRIREFYNAGGSYVGTCAGAIIASQGHETMPNMPNYLGIWPSTFVHTNKDHTSSGMFIEKNSPLLKYFKFGNDNYIDSVRHNMGNYPADLPFGAEVLARYDFKDAGRVHKQPSVTAYKKDAESGRMVLCGSHPEEVQEGERRELTAAMILYALDGIGMTKLKGVLTNGEERCMDRHTYERNPDFTRIGDLQCHHFAIDLPQGARDVKIELVGASGSHLSLALCKDTYAYEDCAEFISVQPSDSQTIVMPKPRTGLWYVCVKCHDTVTATNTAVGHVYSKPPIEDLLNGIPYTIKATWK